MNKELVFDVSEIYYAFQHSVAEIDLACADMEGIFTRWLQGRLTMVRHLPFAQGALKVRDYPDWLVHKVEKHCRHAESLLFHWMKLPNDIGTITQIEVRDTDLFLQYNPKE